MTLSQVSLQHRSIRYVKGVGPRRLEHLARLGIETVEDACWYAPRRYEDRTHFSTIRELQPGQSATIRAKVLAKGLRRLRGSRTLVEVAVGDSSGVLHALWFHQPYLIQQLRLGDELILYGRLEPGSRRQFIHPELETVDDEETESDASAAPEHAAPLHMGRIVPIYALTSGVSQRWLRRVIATVLDHASQTLEDPLPASILQRQGWPPLSEALRTLHFPPSMDALELARQRLAFEELFALQVALAQRRARTLRCSKPWRYQFEGPLTQRLQQHLPFTLTLSQRQVLQELQQDLAQRHPMHRLLQGEVGCGKTIVLIFLIAVAVQSGYQVAFMSPTELLAEQHVRVVSQYLASLGVTATLLSQGVELAQRRRAAAACALGDMDVVIGTHALLQRHIKFARLALVIIDEQHKFGVIQRAQLAKKTQAPDVLVLTATPIPRTLALSMYGDLSISTITELPPGRCPVKTLWLHDADREHGYAMIREELRQGRQGYVVYPLVDAAASVEKRAVAKELKAATQMAQGLQAVFSTYRVGLLHGQMRSKEKERVMHAFVRGRLHLLVSTVIVEVGLDVPNATIMVIEHPERFGLAQLHQLRGRIGRGSHPATCVVISDATEISAHQRLTAFVGTTDGFQLAEKDLELRGPGHLLGSEQHGWWRFRVADLLRDRVLLERARHEATALVDRDPELHDPTWSGLRMRVARLIARTRLPC